MSQYAILYTPNRVIVGLSLEDQAGKLPTDFSSVFVEPKLDLAGGPWKLDADNATMIAATAEEFQATGRDEAHNQVLAQQIITDFKNASAALKVRASAVSADITNINNIRQLGNAIVNYVDAHAKLLRNTLP